MKVEGITYTTGNEALESDIQATDETLTISFVDVADDDDDGDTTEIVVEAFPRVANISVLDLNICS